MTCVVLSVYCRRRRAFVRLSKERVTYRLHRWTTRTAASPEVSGRLYKVRSTNALVLVLIVFSQEEIAIALQRVVDAPSDLSIVQKQRAICTAARGTVGFVLGRVAGWRNPISKAGFSF